jgi:hypothetical protein
MSPEVTVTTSSRIELAAGKITPGGDSLQVGLRRTRHGRSASTTREDPVYATVTNPAEMTVRGDQPMGSRRRAVVICSDRFGARLVIVD